MIKAQLNRWNTWQSVSTNRRIFSGILVIASITLVTKLLGAAKELVVADAFGTGQAIDAFLFAYLLPAFVINVFSGSFSAAMMPTYIQTKESQGEKVANELFSSLACLVIPFLLLIAVALAICAPPLLALLGSGFTEATMLQTQTLLYYLLPIILITGIGQLYSTIINAGERFAVVAMSPAITPIVTAIALIMFKDEMGINALIVGAGIGSLLELTVLIVTAKHQSIPVLPKWTGMTKQIKVVIGQYVPMMAGAFLMSGTGLVDQSMAAMLEPGSVATLNYANKVVAMILGISSMAIGTAVLPHFSRLVANNDWSALRHTFIIYSRFVMAISVPVTALLFVFSEPITRLLFERGAFTSQDTQLVTQTQAFYLLQLPFYILGVLGVRLISALKKNRILMNLAVINLVVNVLGNYLFIQYFGVAGIALSTAVVYLISTAMIYIYISLNQLRKHI